MTFLFLALARFLHDFILKCLSWCSSFTMLAPFCTGSKINKQQRLLLTLTLRLEDGASSSPCLNSGGH